MTLSPDYLTSIQCKECPWADHTSYNPLHHPVFKKKIFPWNSLGSLGTLSSNCPDSLFHSVQFSSVTQSFLTLRPHEPQHTRPPCASPTPGVHSNSCPSHWWCHPAISPSVAPFSSCPQSVPASGSFPMSQLLAWGGRSTGASAQTPCVVSCNKHCTLLHHNPESVDWLYSELVSGTKVC